MKRNYTNWLSRSATAGPPRRGLFVVLALVAMTVVLAFAAISVDYSRLVMTKQEMQNAVDAAALAAAMEITAAVETAGPDVGNVVQYAQAQARLKAAEVAALNGVYVDPVRDVEFGRRFYNPATQKFETDWSAEIANVVRVTARRDNPDPSEPDAFVRLPFAGAIGRGSQPLTTSAAAFVESRDIVCVIDFSRSMNFDSYFASEEATSLTHEQIVNNIELVWDDLGNPTWGNMPWLPDWVTIPSTTWGNNVNVRWQDTSVYVTCNSDLQRVRLTFDNGNIQTFSTTVNSGTWSGTGSNSGRPIHKCEVRKGSLTWESFDFFNNSHIQRGLGLTGVAYPWPSGSWSNYFNMVRNVSSGSSYFDPKIGEHGFRKKFGIMTFLHYQLRFEASYARTPDFWKTRHYPFHSVKEGQKLLCDFLEELSFNDYVGFVSYDTYHRIEQVLNSPGMPSVDISAKPITNDYQAIRDLIHHKQAGHYFYATNIGGGLKSARALLDAHGRVGARPTILLMTDGNSNTMDAGENGTLPGGWDWDALFDYDGDGVADYTTSYTQKRHVLKKAKECVDAGYTIHTMSVGSGADTELMRAVAFLGRGIYIEVPGGQSVSDLEDDVKEAFNRIASFVPPAQLMSDED
ncbi:MAG TPA: pilus assembly protein TadG-related protein [Pirellulaceae bacterium]|nr:pilus assembly protein TadG-related protein [Pirellulaceae bacterium]